MTNQDPQQQPQPPNLPEGQRDPAAKAWDELASFVGQAGDAATQLQEAARKLSLGADSSWQARFERFLKGWKGSGTPGVVDPDSLKMTRFHTADDFQRYVEGGGRGVPPEQGGRPLPPPPHPATPTGPTSPTPGADTDLDELRKEVERLKRERADKAKTPPPTPSAPTPSAPTQEQLAALVRTVIADALARLVHGGGPRMIEGPRGATEGGGGEPPRVTVTGFTANPPPPPRPTVAKAAEFLKGSYHLDTLSGRSPGAAPAGGEALGSSFVGLAGRATAAAAVLSKLWESGNKLVDEQEQAARKIAQFSPSIAAAVGQLDAQRAMRALQTGEKTAATTSAMTAAINRKEQAQQPIDILVTNVKNTAATVWANFQTKLFEALGPMAEAANKSLGMGKDSDTATWSGLLPELAAERGVTQKAAEDRMRFVNDIMNGR
jgi:hypothetical protein